MDRSIKVLKVDEHNKDRLTVGNKYRCLDNHRHTAILDDDGEILYITLGINEDRFEVIE